MESLLINPKTTNLWSPTITIDRARPSKSLHICNASRAAAQCYQAYFVKLNKFVEYAPKTASFKEWYLENGCPLIASTSDLEEYLSKHKDYAKKFMEAAKKSSIHLCVSEMTLVNNLQCHILFPPVGKIQASVDASYTKGSDEAHIASVLTDENGIFLDVITAVVRVQGSVEGELWAILHGYFHLSTYIYSLAGEGQGHVIASDCNVCTKWVNEGREPAKHLPNHEKQLELVRYTTSL